MMIKTGREPLSQQPSRAMRRPPLASNLRRGLTLLLLLSLLSLPGGRGEAYLPAAYGGTVTVPLPDAPLSLDPSRAVRASEVQLAALLYDTLFRLEAGSPRPHLIEGEPVIEADGTRWRLRLLAGVKLSSGQLLVAEHVASALRRVMRGPNAHLLAVVKGVQAAGPLELLLELRRPAPELRWLLSAPATGIAISQGGKLQGTGPYWLARRSAELIQLKAHIAHFAGRPYLDELRFQLFEQASAEVAAFQVGTLQLSLRGKSVFGGHPRHEVVEHDPPLLSPVVLALGRGASWLDQPQLRRALLAGIDRRRLARLAAQGQVEVASGSVPSSLLAGQGPAAPVDRPLAQRLLAKAWARHLASGVRGESGKARLSLLVDASRLEDGILAGQIVADLDRLGVLAAISAEPAKQYQLRLEQRDYELALVRPALQVPLASAALARVLAAAGQEREARSCLAAASCGITAARLASKRLPVLPLIHVGQRLYHDARLGALRVTPGGWLTYADAFWLRGAP